MATRWTAWAVISVGLCLAAGCDRNSSDSPSQPQQAQMQPLPTMPQPALQPGAAAVPQPTVALGPADPRTQWDEQRIARLEAQVSGLVQDNAAIHQQLAQTQAELRETEEAVRRMQGQASAARRTIQGYRNQVQQQ